MNQRWHAVQLAKRILSGAQPKAGFGGTTELTAELDPGVVSELRMTSALDRFGQRLIDQHGKTASGSIIVGVELRSINFSFITAAKGAQ